MHNLYNYALMSEEGTRLRGAIHDAIDDYVRYFESCGLQIEPSWVTKAQMEASIPYCGLEKEAPIDPEYEATEAIIDVVRTILASRGLAAVAEVFEMTERPKPENVVSPKSAA
jgi:hypothetical protein